MADVLNRTTKVYLRSVNTPDYPTESWIINPDLSGVSGVLQKYWKIVGDTVVEMTQPEKDAVDEAEIAKTILPKNFRVYSYNSGNNLTSEAWYATDNGNGTYSDLVFESEYQYDDGKLASRIDTTYFADGTVAESQVYSYFETTNSIIEKKV